MNKSIPQRTYVASALLCLMLFASCSADEGTALPEGKYPMTFATAMEGLTQTRATTDNTWAGNEKIAVQVGGEVKEYKPAASGAEATLTGTNAVNTFYWQHAGETKLVSAWYCGDGSTASRRANATQLPATWTVQADQSGNGYAKSDLLYAKPTNISFSGRKTAKLSFNHLPAKVIIHLKSGDGLTVADVEGATVSIVSQATTSGTINAANGTVAQITNSGTEAITPNVLAVPESGFQKSVQAIVVPQKVAANTRFIKVTIGTGTAARDYYYTTETADDANLECGNQYMYEITVTKTGLSVNIVSMGRWTSSDMGGGTLVIPAEFNINLSGMSLPSLSSLNGITLQAGSSDRYKTTNGNSFSFSITLPKGQRTGFSIQKGIAEEERTAVKNGDGSTITYTFAYTNVRSDLWLKYGDYPEVGDYYYADGSFSPTYIASGPSTCIGIVFKVGSGTGDAGINYGDKLPDGIRGYAVALTDATQDVCEWGERNTIDSSTDTPLDNVQLSDNADYNGFGNTGTIIEKYWNTDKWHFYDAFQAIIDYRKKVNAPQNSSDWYLPSLKQLADIYSLYQNTKGCILYDRLEDISADNLFREAPEMDIATGTPPPRGRGGYWASTEYNHVDAWFIRFTDGVKEHFGKGQDWHKDSFVRAILTF